MKKLLVPLSSAFLLASAFAQDQPKHIISIDTEGFGWSALAQVYDWDMDDSSIKDHDSSEGKFALNYSFVFPTRFMVGIDLSAENDKSEIKYVDGTKATSETRESQIGISVGYNFNEDLYRSWWVRGIIGRGAFESEDKATDGSKTELEYDYSFWGVSAGKRFSLESWGLKPVSYNPSISYHRAKIGGDAEDAGLKTVSNLRIDFLRIDILF